MRFRRFAIVMVGILAATGIAQANEADCQKAAQMLESLASLPMVERLPIAQAAAARCPGFDTHYRLGLIHHALGQYEEARTHYAQARASAGDDLRNATLSTQRLAELSIDTEKPCIALARMRVTAQEIKAQGRQIESWFEKRLLQLERELAADGVTAEELTCQFQEQKRALQTAARSQRNFCMANTLDIPVPFDTNQWNLSSEGQAQVAALIQALSAEAWDGAVLEVRGHTDQRGSDAHNQTLSEHRARSVAGALKDALKVPADRVRSVGLGERAPRDRSDDESAWSLNRRVEVVVMPDSCAP